jgi:hypothetical protein
MAKPTAEEVMESIEDEYGYSCELVSDDAVRVTDVRAKDTEEIAKFVSVRGYTASVEDIKNPEVGDIIVE